MNRPPKPSPAVKAFRGVFGWTMQVSGRRAAIVSASAFAGVAALDFVTGPGVSVMLGYLIVIALVAWTLGERLGFATIAATLVTTNLLNGFGSAYPADGMQLTTAVTLWNSASRGIVAVLIVMLVSTLRYLLAVESWRASTDPLTGVLNKRAFTEELRHLVERARVSGDHMVLAYMDLDGFKGVNDGHGHAAGDRVLRAFATEARARIRQADLFARVGGDEFAALLVIDDHVRGEAVAEALHARLSDALSATGYAVSCSMGAVVIDKPLTCPLASVIEAADALTYEVKRTGKNALRIAFIGDTPAPSPSTRRNGTNPMRQAA